MVDEELRDAGDAAGNSVRAIVDAAVLGGGRVAGTIPT
jgi:hypothetical protein